MTLLDKLARARLHRFFNSLITNSHREGWQRLYKSLMTTPQGWGEGPEPCLQRVYCNCCAKLPHPNCSNSLAWSIESKKFWRAFRPTILAESTSTAGLSENTNCCV